MSDHALLELLPLKGKNLTRWMIQAFLASCLILCKIWITANLESPSPFPIFKISWSVSELQGFTCHKCEVVQYVSVIVKWFDIDSQYSTSGQETEFLPIIWPQSIFSDCTCIIVSPCHRRCWHCCLLTLLHLKYYLCKTYMIFTKY